MREISVPIRVESEPRTNLTDLVVGNAADAPDAALFARKEGDGGWRDVTAREFLAEVTALAKGLVAAGVQPGDRVGLMSRTRYEWTLVDFAIWFAGGVTVPVYETSSAEQVRWILSDSGAVGVFVESEALAATVGTVRDQIPGLRDVWVIDADAVGSLGAQAADVADDEIERRRTSLSGDSIATIIYTSGTTGRPKGCELTHDNFLSSARNSVRMFDTLVAPGKSTLLFLPLAHVFARYVEVLCLAGRAKLAHSSPASLLEDLSSFRPTFLLAVPRVFEKIYNSAEARAESGGRGEIFRRAARVAVAYSQAQDRGGPGLALRAQHVAFDRLVYGKLRALTGGRLEAAVSGGAPLGERLGHFYRGVGFMILEGWGLTESTAPATVNLLSRQQIGTVGRPLPGVTIKVADDGELLVKGICVMRGYYNNPQATADALHDGWFSTGDLGEIDDEGYVRITGRKKEIIITAGGKNVVPAVLEDRLRAHPLISQCMVVGDQRPFIAALITLDAEMLPTWLANKGKPAMDVATAAADPDVRAELQKAVDDANTLVSKAESIRKFTVLDVDFTEEEGHLTPKQSLRRHIVAKQFEEQIEQIYR